VAAAQQHHLFSYRGVRPVHEPIIRRARSFSIVFSSSAIFLKRQSPIARERWVSYTPGQSNALSLLVIVKKLRLRSIPAVEKVLQNLGETHLPRPVVVSLVRQQLADLRTAQIVPPWEEVLQRIQRILAEFRLSKIQPVINGTGIVIHTNLGGHRSDRRSSKRSRP
jgi:hypothetical protein